MKTKLLKRLRKEAKNRYMIKRMCDEYRIYTRIDMGFLYYFSISSSPYKGIEDAKKACNSFRREYILRKVRYLRNEQEEFIDF